MNPTPEELADEWKLVPEAECDDQDDYPDDEAIRRDIVGWQDSVAAWEQGSGTREVSILSDGSVIGPGAMTHEELEALKVRFTYDPLADAVSVFWGVSVEVSDEIAPGVILDYDIEGKVVGVEILGASKKLQTLTDASEIQTLLPQPAKEAAA